MSRIQQVSAFMRKREKAIRELDWAIHRLLGGADVRHGVVVSEIEQWQALQAAYDSFKAADNFEE